MGWAPFLIKLDAFTKSYDFFKTKTFSSSYKAWLRMFSLDWPLIVHCVEISVNTAWEYITQVDTLEYIIHTQIPKSTPLKQPFNTLHIF